MSDDDDFSVIRRFNAAGHQADDSALDELLAPDFVAHNGDEDVHGVDGWRAFLASGTEQFGPSEAGIEELIRGGGFIAERWWLRLTSPASTGADRMHGITMHRIVDGRIAEQWAVMQMDE